jgi:hypothetical protein
VPLIASLLFLSLSATLVLFEADPAWIWAAALCNAGSLVSFWAARRAMSPALRLSATAIIVVYLINYPLQALFVDWLYHSERFQSTWREFSLIRLDGSIESRADVFYLITAVFALLCTAMVLFSTFFRSHVDPPEPAARSTEGGQTLWMLLALGMVIAIVGLLIQITFGVGSLTSEAAFTGRLDGVLYHTLVTLVPLLFMAVHWESVRKGLPGLARVSLASYLLLALAEMGMMSSRGFVVLQMLPLLLLYLWMGRSLRKLAWLGAITVALTVLLYPVMTSVRILRANSGYDASGSIVQALTSPNEARDLTADLVRMAARFIGYTSYLTSLEHPDDRFDWSELSIEKIVTLRENGFTRWFTAQIAGYGRGIQRHFSSPGILGAAQVLGGTPLVVLLPAGLALATLLVVGFLEGRPSRLGPLVPVNLLASLLFLMEEGVFDLILTRLILVGLALLMLNWIFHLSVPDSRSDYATH